MAILIKNIKALIQVEEKFRPNVSGKEMASLPTVKDAWIFIDEGRIIDFGTKDSYEIRLPAGQAGIMNHEKSTHKLTSSPAQQLTTIDATGKLVFPSFCDSHTHLVYAGSREIEYIDKIKGLSYEEIARRGGGILNSAKRLHKASEEELVEHALARLNEIMMLGTGAVEIKSGYGLSVEDELKMLRVVRRLKEISPLTVVATFLGAHALPEEYKGRQDEFVDLVINEMIPQVAAEGLADYIDVFCDRGFFTPEDTDRILLAGMKYGMRPKIHANELEYSGGIQVGVKYNALSVDHLEYTGDEEIKCLLGSETMPTILPGAAFFLGLQHAPVRKMMDAGLPLAMASDFNPGSSPSGNMQFILSLACINYRMLPEEAINAVTLNSAYAMGVSEELGTIARGKKANLFITRPIPGYEFMPYAYGSNKVETVILGGKVITNQGLRITE
ncbi:MAG: imidazolonepropionase [Bacteroidetes bacterium]|nr:imidazolonepropionase [Bacteroidota bacterium]